MSEENLSIGEQLIVSEALVEKLEAESKMFTIFLEESSLKHSFESFKGEFRRRLEKKAQAEANKAKMKAANDKAAEVVEVVEEVETVEAETLTPEELMGCKPGIQLPDEAEEDNDEFTESEPTTVEVEEEVTESSDELDEGEL